MHGVSEYMYSRGGRSNSAAYDKDVQRAEEECNVRCGCRNMLGESASLYKLQSRS